MKKYTISSDHPKIHYKKSGNGKVSLYPILEKSNKFNISLGNAIQKLA
ncbi:hypothetical protein [Chryseobacterium sp. PMSZPI]|nr:hypothetical protein [Chryseobacterium sp. PMSZPI]